MGPNPENATVYSTDDVMENFSENYQLCQLIRDESYGWPMQDPSIDADPFNTAFHQPLDFDISAFDSSEQTDSPEWSQPWPVKPDSPMPQLWQQLVINLDSPNLKSPVDSTSVSLPLPGVPLPSTSLTPSLAALDFPNTSLPEELDYSVLGGRQENFSNCEEDYPIVYPQNVNVSRQQFPVEWDYQPTDLGSGSYVMQQSSDPANIITIGIYTRAERRAKIERFRLKRQRRNFAKRVLYCSRKRFADSRPRVGGRFVVNENRVIKPKMFLKRGRPRKIPLLPVIDCLAVNLLD